MTGISAACSLLYFGLPMEPNAPEEAPFVPKGAVAFFAALIVFFAAVWLSLYALLVSRT
jgi:hypothetical protein